MDKNVGFITFVSQNYGTCLQGFAMRKAIERASGGAYIKFFHFVRSTSYIPRPLVARIFNMALKALKHPSDVFHIRQRKKIENDTAQRFKSFQNLIFSDQEKFFNISELLGKDLNLSAVVCGSDMIWSPEFSKYLDVYMLSWCKYARKISYAPSIGSTNINKELKHKYRTYLEGFSSISCREKSGCEFLKNITGKETPLVVDPTLLFTAKEWLQWFPEEKTVNNPYILIYCFGGITPYMRKQLCDYARLHKLSLRFILSPDVHDTVNELKYGDGAYGPAEYVRLFANATFTVVNGYHGLLFSLIFEKPFVVLHRDKSEHWGNHENRMVDILETIKQSNRYIEPESLINETMYTLDYSSINPQLEELREYSWNYLNNSLK